MIPWCVYSECSLLTSSGCSSETTDKWYNCINFQWQFLRAVWKTQLLIYLFHCIWHCFWFIDKENNNNSLDPWLLLCSVISQVDQTVAVARWHLLSLLRFTVCVRQELFIEPCLPPFTRLQVTAYTKHTAHSTNSKILTHIKQNLYLLLFFLLYWLQRTLLCKS